MFQELPFYNSLIERPGIKHLKNIHFLYELPFYDKLSIKQISKSFKKYSRCYKIKTIDLLDEIKDFKYQVTVKILLTQHTENTDKEFGHVYFNSTTKIVINSKDNLDKSSQEILYRINNWINEGSGWVVKSIVA